LFRTIKTNGTLTGSIKINIKMKKYLIIFCVLALVACNNSNKAQETSNGQSDVRQRTIDSMEGVNSAAHHNHEHSSEHHYSEAGSNSSSSNTNNSEGNDTRSTEPAKRKGMSNTTKGALIGTGVGIVGGVLTGAATSQDKGKGALEGGIIGGAVGSGAGYGIGAEKDKNNANK
jgi:hypothetical protein